MPSPWRHAGAVLGTLLALAGCAAGTTPEAARPRAGIPATPLPEADFDAYLEKTHAHIAHHGTNGAGPLPEDVVRDRAPFALTPDPACPQPVRRGALLLHDLGGTPFEMRDLGRRLAAACFHVRGILLPGHGTAPGDLATIEPGAWQEAVTRGRTSFAETVESVALIGFGLGGTLAIRESQTPGAAPRVEALVLIAPRIAAGPSWFGLDGILAAGAGSGGAEPALTDPVRYTVLPERAEEAAERLVAEISRDARAIALPVLLVQSADDGIADPEAGWAWFCQRVVGPRRQIWYAKGNARPGFCAFVAARASDGWPGILGFSHAGLPIDPANPRLGAEVFAPQNCDHYGPEQSLAWLICADPVAAAHHGVRLGAMPDAAASEGVVRRIGWNPDFDNMVGDIVAFLGKPGTG